MLVHGHSARGAGAGPVGQPQARLPGDQLRRLAGSCLGHRLPGHGSGEGNALRLQPVCHYLRRRLHRQHPRPRRHGVHAGFRGRHHLRLVTMFHDPTFYKSFLNNLIYLLIVVVMQLGIGLVFAVLLTFMKKHVTFVKTLYYVPCIITTVAIAQLFRSMYATEPMGLINQFFQAIGMEGMVTSWLANIHTALIAVSVPEGWRFTGMYMVIFYAALISLDPSVYEAAKVDGATDFQILLKIKLPLIKDIILLTLTMCLTGALRGFDIPFLLTSGGPGNASELLSTYMYKKAFSNNQYGYGSALAVFIIIESMLVVFILRKIFSERKECKES